MPSEMMDREEFVTRGALAAQTGCNIETIRYYEQIGILPPPPRSDGGHRLYGQTLVRRLNFVRRSRDLGFTLEEIRELAAMIADVVGFKGAIAFDTSKPDGTPRKLLDVSRLTRLETIGIAPPRPRASLRGVPP